MPTETAATPSTPDVSVDTTAESPSEQTLQPEPADAQQRGVAMVLAEAAATPPPGPHNAIDALGKGAIHVDSIVSDADAKPVDRVVTPSVDDISPTDGAPSEGPTDAPKEGPVQRDDLDGMVVTVGTASRTEPAAGDVVSQAEAVAGAADAKDSVKPETKSSAEQIAENNKKYYENIVNEAKGRPGIPVSADSDVDDIIQKLGWDPKNENARRNVEGAIAHAKALETAKAEAEKAEAAKAKAEAAKTPEQSEMVTKEQVAQIVDAAVAKNTEAMRAEMKADRESTAAMVKELMTAIKDKEKREAIFKKILAFLAGFVQGSIIKTTEESMQAATNPGGGQQH